MAPNNTRPLCHGHYRKDGGYTTAGVRSAMFMTAALAQYNMLRHDIASALKKGIASTVLSENSFLVAASPLLLGKKRENREKRKKSGEAAMHFSVFFCVFCGRKKF